MAILNRTETLTKNDTLYTKITYYEIDELGEEKIKAIVETLPQEAAPAQEATALERIEANTDYLVMITEV